MQLQSADIYGPSGFKRLPHLKESLSSGAQCHHVADRISSF